MKIPTTVAIAGLSGFSASAAANQQKPTAYNPDPGLTTFGLIAGTGTGVGATGVATFFSSAPEAVKAGFGTKAAIAGTALGIGAALGHAVTD